MSPSGRISRTVQGSQGGGEKVRVLPIGQFPEDPLRILRMFSGLDVHGVMVRPDAGRMPQPPPSVTEPECRQAAPARNVRSTSRDKQRPLTLLTWEPVSGFEPLACRLQEVRPYP